MRTLCWAGARLGFVATLIGLSLVGSAFPCHAGTITACVNKQGKIKGVDVSCKTKLTTLSWDSTGVPGPPGPPGPKGPAGTNGTNLQVLTGGTLGADSGFLLGIVPGTYSPSNYSVPKVYLAPGNGGSITSGDVDVPVTAGTLSNLLVSVGVYPPDCASTSCDYSFALCVNGNCSATPSLTCTTTGVKGEASCSDTTDIVTVNDGDRISILATATSASSGPADVTFSLEHATTLTTP